MNAAILRLGVLLVGAATLHAEYVLPAISDRRVLLVAAKELAIAVDPVDVPAGLTRIFPGGRLTITRDARSAELAIDGTWLQDRMYSTAVCCGIDRDDPRAAIHRLRAMAALLADPARADTSVLVEVVRPVGGARYHVSYVAALDVERAFPRYFGTATDGERIAMDLERTPRDAAKWRLLLADETRETFVALTNQPDPRPPLTGAELTALLAELEAWKAVRPLDRDRFVELAIRTRRLLGARRLLDDAGRARLTELGSIGSREHDALRVHRLMHAMDPGQVTPHSIELDVDRDGRVAELLVEYPAVRGEPADRTQLEMLVVHARRMDFHQLAAKGGELFPVGSSVSPAFRIACAPYRDATGSTYTFFQSSSEHGSAQAILQLDGDRVVKFDSVEVRRSR